MSTRLWWLAVALTLSGCPGRGLAVSQQGLMVAPAQVALGPVWVGVPREFSLTLTNTGRVTITARLVHDGLESTVDTLDVLAGDEVVVTLTLTAEQPGALTREVQVHWDDQVVAVAVTAEVAQVPTCAQSDECRARHFEVATGLCVDTLVPEGTPCGSANQCLLAGRCHEGACVGQQKVCNDGNLCTADACDPARGCVFIDTVAACPAVTNPCEVPVCNGASGCSTAPVADGTACGARDCSTAKVCLSGQCVERAVPDGASCGEATLCQPRGICRDHLCEAQAPVPLQPVWTYQPIGTYISSTTISNFPGVLDEAGNLYWLESDAFLVSADRDGRLRFRRALTPANGSTPRALSIVHDTVIVQTAINTPSLLDGYSTGTGALLWQLLGADLKMRLHLPSTAQLWVIDVHEQAGTNAMVVNLRANNGGASWFAWVAAFDVSTASLQWVFARHYLDTVIGDEVGNSYTYDDLFQHELISVDVNGGLRFSSLVSQWPLLVTQHTLLTSGVTFGIWDSSGTPLREVPGLYVSTYGPETLATHDTMVVLQENPWCAGRPEAGAVRAFSISTGAQKFDLSVGGAPCMADVTLTSRDGLFFRTHRDFSSEDTVHQTSSDGGTLFECPLASTSSLVHGVLDRQRYFVFDQGTSTILAFDLPGVEVATSGWVTLNGNSSRSRRSK